MRMDLNLDWLKAIDFILFNSNLPLLVILPASFKCIGEDDEGIKFGIFPAFHLGLQTTWLFVRDGDIGLLSPDHSASHLNVEWGERLSDHLFLNGDFLFYVGFQKAL